MNAAVIVENRQLAGLQTIIDQHMAFLPNDWELIQLKPIIRNLQDYNRFMTRASTWEPLIKYDRVLIFQHDSMILRDGIEEFLEWDYVGAPWKFQEHGGNGGLSLRNPRKNLEVIKHREWSMAHGYEDVFICNHLHEVGGKLAPREVCQRFSVEAIFQLGTWGYHQIHSHLSSDQCEQIKNQYKS
jgi:hypothetical protein